jgi:hypothetical protein
MGYMSAIGETASLIAGFFLLSEPSALATSKPKKVDGFEVTILSLSSKDTFPFPTEVSGTVAYSIGTTAVGMDPFQGIQNLENVSPYLSIQPGAAATFTYSSPQTEFQLLWGSPDKLNSISFYDASDDLIGTLSGAAFLTAFGLPVGQGEQTVRIASTVPFLSYRSFSRNRDAALSSPTSFLKSASARRRRRSRGSAGGAPPGAIRKKAAEGPRIP